MAEVVLPDTNGFGTRRLLFGRYEMGRLLGHGTFAKVYYAKHLPTGDSVAIKVINKDHVRRESMVEQIVREISVMRLVRHPNVVDLREVMATKTRIFFVMEYVRGGELFAVVSKGKLQEHLARRYFHQLISAVDFCHSRGVSHRDIKPDNLLLDDAGDLKVSDFGLSALPDQQWKDGLLHTQCGTPAYVAPEVLRKRGYDGGKADLWSCGVVLYVLLAGFLPFQDENVMVMYTKVFKAEYKFPPWFSAGARRLISLLLVADPEKRITVPEILKDPWFQKDFSSNPPVAPPTHPAAAAVEKGEKTAPAFYNAFELISAMSSGFDLSGMFESKRKPGTVFTSKWPAGEIVGKLEEVGRGFGLVATRAEEYKVWMEGWWKGSKMSLTAEVFEVAPELAVVEFCKSACDIVEYAKFCEECLRPGLKDVVWTWRGDNSGGATTAGQNLGFCSFTTL